MQALLPHGGLPRDPAESGACHSFSAQFSFFCEDRLLKGTLGWEKTTVHSAFIFYNLLFCLKHNNVMTFPDL